MKFIISGGGTGGHIYPGIAIAREIKSQYPDARILFVGAKGKMEMYKVPQSGFHIEGLPIRGLQRTFSLSNLTVPFRIVSSLWKARNILKDFKPDVVIGTGGYASAAVLQMAVWLKIPTLIQEQNSYAGLVNRILGPKVGAVCVAYTHMEQFFTKENVFLTGNPVRSDINIDSIDRQEAYTHFNLDPNKKTLFVLGGSLGSLTINETFIKGIDKILDKGYQVIWQTGKSYLHSVLYKVKDHTSKKLYINDFINEMGLAYAIADVVVARAGALSISELCVMNKACIFVPSPNVAEDHQTKNAMALFQEGAAWMVKDKDARKTLVDQAIALLDNLEEQELLKTKIKAFAYPDATKAIVEKVLELRKSHSNKSKKHS